MKKNLFEKIKNEKFSKLDVKKMSRVRGGTTLNTLTGTCSGGHCSWSDDGNGCSCDGVCND